jgi:hypothetical protein
VPLDRRYVPVSRPPRARARRAAIEASEHLERTDTWSGLRRGDPVIVSGLHIRGAEWEFRAHILNHRNGAKSVEVIGGRPGDRKIRSFEPERIFAVTGRKRHGGDADRSISGELSLAEAPQLPLA